MSAVLFTFILFQPWAMIYFFFAIPIPAIVYAVLYVGYTIWANRRGGSNINHSAHLWGAAYGVAFVLVMKPEVLSLFADRLMHPRFCRDEHAAVSSSTCIDSTTSIPRRFLSAMSGEDRFTSRAKIARAFCR